METTLTTTAERSKALLGRNQAAKLARNYAEAAYSLAGPMGNDSPWASLAMGMLVEADRLVALAALLDAEIERLSDDTGIVRLDWERLDSGRSSAAWAYHLSGPDSDGVHCYRAVTHRGVDAGEDIYVHTDEIVGERPAMFDTHGCLYTWMSLVLRKLRPDMGTPVHQAHGGLLLACGFGTGGV